VRAACRWSPRGRARARALGRAATLVLALAPTFASADPYVDAFARAGELEAAGRVREAAELLERSLADYPQDYALALQVAWLRYQSGDHARAEALYRRCIALSGGVYEARLGLAWSLLLQGERTEAEAVFAALADEAPNEPLVREGLAASRARIAVIARPSAALTGQLYPYQGGLSAALGASLSLPLVIRERGLVGVDYNYARFADRATTARAGAMQMNMNGAGGGLGPGGPGLRDSAIDRHALYLHAGAAWVKAGFTGHYGYINDGGRLIGNAHIAGLAVRYSPLGDITLAAVAGVWPDQVIPRVALAWAAPATRWLTVTPGAAVQVADGRALGAGSLAAAVHGRRGALWVGGKFGPERRPVYLHVPATFSVEGEIRWGLWAGARLELPRRFNIFAGWELHRFTGLDAGAVVTSAHTLAIGVGWRSHPAPEPRGPERKER
jgi:hypothetical protein